MKNRAFILCHYTVAGAVGIEPTHSVLETEVLPLYDAPMITELVYQK